MSNETKMEPCPFCGGEDISKSNLGGCWEMACKKCWAKTGLQNELGEAIAAWNRRAPLAPSTPPSPTEATVHVPGREEREDALRTIQGHQIPEERLKEELAKYIAAVAYLEGERDQLKRDYECSCIESDELLAELKNRAEGDGASESPDTQVRAKFKVVPNGPPCPTCGFKIEQKERPPFQIEDDDTQTGDGASELAGKARLARKAWWKVAQERCPALAEWPQTFWDEAWEAAVKAALSPTPSDERGA